MEDQVNQLLTRISKLERRNLFLWITLVVSIPIALWHRTQVREPITLEARQLVIKDENGKVTAWLGTAPLNSESLKGVSAWGDIPFSAGASGVVSGLFLFSDNGKVAGSFIPVSGGGSVLEVKGDADGLTHITGDGVELFGKGGHMAGDFKSSPNSFLDLHDDAGNAIWSAQFGTTQK
jgi:hypothetical protein